MLAYASRASDALVTAHVYEMRYTPPKLELRTAGDIKTGFLEKRIGDKSGRQNLPESWKWQKRYFVLTEPKGMLYYFKSADDPPNYRGLVDLR